MNRGAVRAAAQAAAQVVGDTAKLQSFRITKFGRHKDGYFHARVTVGGETFYVHCRWGSWFLPKEIGSHSGREVLSPYKEALTEKMRAFERSEIRYKLRRKEEALATAQNASDAGRLLRLIGYEDDEIVTALMEQFKMTRAKACSTMQQVDKHLTQQEEATHGPH